MRVETAGNCSSLGGFPSVGTRRKLWGGADADGSEGCEVMSVPVRGLGGGRGTSVTTGEGTDFGTEEGVDNDSLLAASPDTALDDPMILHELVFSFAWGTGIIPYILQRCDEDLLQRCDEDFDRPMKFSVAGVLRTYEKLQYFCVKRRLYVRVRSHCKTSISYIHPW
jgi:hypothetical protein